MADRNSLISDFTRIIDEAIALGREQMRQELGMQLGFADKPRLRIRERPVQPQPPVSPQKRGAQDRAEHGAIKGAVHKAIQAHPMGVGRPGIVRYAKDTLGVIVKDGSLKNALRILKAEEQVTNADGKWFPKA